MYSEPPGPYEYTRCRQSLLSEGLVREVTEAHERRWSPIHCQVELTRGSVAPLDQAVRLLWCVVRWAALLPRILHSKSSTQVQIVGPAAAPGAFLNCPALLVC